MSKLPKGSTVEKKKKGKRTEDSEQSGSRSCDLECDNYDSQQMTDEQLEAQIAEKKQLDDLMAPLVDPGIDEFPQLPRLKPIYDDAGRTVYLEMCQLLQIVPVSYFLRHCEDSYLNLSHLGLGELGVEALCKAMATNPFVLNLNASDNWIGPIGMVHVSELLKVSLLIELNLAKNNLGSAGAKLIGEVLYNNPPHLKFLNISYNNFQDTDAQYIGVGLDGNDRLLEIDLSHNNFGIQAGKIFSNQVANTILEKMDLSWNNIRAAGAIALATAIRGTAIQHLNLSWNGFAEEGGVIIGRSLTTNTAIQYLDLRNNRIGLNGAQAIAKSLDKNETIVTLRLAGNPITYEGALAFMKVFAKSMAQPSTTAVPASLKLLDIKDITVSVEFHTIYTQLKEVREIQIDYLCGDFHLTEIPLKTRRQTSGEQRLKRLLAIEKEFNVRMFDIFTSLEQDVITALDLRPYIENNYPRVPRVICDEIAINLSSDGNVYKEEILEVFRPIEEVEVIA